MFAGEVLNKTLPATELSKFDSNPFAKLGHIQVVRDFVNSPQFPFRKAWDLQTKGLMWYLTMDQVLDHRWKIEDNLFNAPEDENYVMNNIIQDHETIGSMDRETMMQPRQYAFVSSGKVYQYIGEKLKLTMGGQLEVTNAAGDDLGRLGGMQ